MAKPKCVLCRTNEAEKDGFCLTCTNVMAALLHLKHVRNHLDRVVEDLNDTFVEVKGQDGKPIKEPPESVFIFTKPLCEGINAVEAQLSFLRSYVRLPFLNAMVKIGEVETKIEAAAAKREKELIKEGRCPECGQPKDLCMCDDMAKEEKRQKKTL